MDKNVIENSSMTVQRNDGYGNSAFLWQRKNRIIQSVPLLPILPRPIFVRKAGEHNYLYVFALIVLWFTFFFLSRNVQAVEVQPANPETSSTAAKSSQNSTDDQPLSPEDVHITAYTKAFAERFALEPPAPGTEPSGGLQAIELTVEKLAKWSDHYNCHFRLYVDSDLPIKLPELGGIGNSLMLNLGSHFFSRPLAQWRKWTVDDRKYWSLHDGSYNMKAFLATMDYVPNKKGAIDSITYVEYHKDLLPGLTYIQLDVTMGLLLETYTKDVGIFLQKDSETDYRSRITIEPGNFIKFRLPDHVYNKLREWDLKMAKISKMLREEKKRKKRELHTNQQ